MRIIFLGTPEFALPSLQKLLSSHHKILAVVTQKDKETNRKGEIVFPPVKSLALKHGLKVLQYDNISNEGVCALKQLDADIMITVAYGQILSQELLNLTKYGTINVHSSLLPKYRGASPMQAALLNGDDETGVSIMQTVLEMDAGDILNVEKMSISNKTTLKDVHDILSDLGATALLKTLDEIEDGTVKRLAQDETKATHTKKINKQDGIINWARPAKEILRQINAMNPWPGAFTFLNGKIIKILNADVIDPRNFKSALDLHLYNDGTCFVFPHNICIKTGDGILGVSCVQLEGKKPLTALEIFNGGLIKSETTLG
ncbi:MAG: methionyl-tRNA formyltransferase [Firmicutes bacterium]|nr:methionyl-tRNA formyltransferase [Bacillota bacterium]MCL2255773.1 methionyl-tRNA formyltransferase [Bacillota bacterium]